MTAPGSVFARHIDSPNRRHRCVLIDERHLRCLDCDHTLVIPSGVTTTSTSLRELPNIDDPLGCPEHPGNWAATCGLCRSERIAIPDGQTKTRLRPEPADPGPEWDAVRQQLAQRTRPPKDPQCSSASTAPEDSTTNTSATSDGCSTRDTTSTSAATTEATTDPNAGAATPDVNSGVAPGQQPSGSTSTTDPTHPTITTDPTATPPDEDTARAEIANLHQQAETSDEEQGEGKPT